MNAVKKFQTIANEPQFAGWPIIGKPRIWKRKIPFFGKIMQYHLKTGNGKESYYSIIRNFGWAVCFGVTTDNNVITLVQWKPGVNQASWELPPGGIGPIAPGTELEEIQSVTEKAYLKETGYGKGNFSYLGHIIIESGKYRGSGPNEHGLPAHLFMARNLVKMQEARDPEKNEIMRTLEVPFEEFQEVLDSGLFVEASAVACAYKALCKLGL